MFSHKFELSKLIDMIIGNNNNARVVSTKNMQKALSQLKYLLDSIASLAPSVGLGLSPVTFMTRPS